MCQVYDVVWHTDSVEMAQKDGNYQRMMVELALGHIKQKKNHILNSSKATYRIKRIYYSKNEV